MIDSLDYEIHGIRANYREALRYACYLIRENLTIVDDPTRRRSSLTTSPRYALELMSLQSTESLPPPWNDSDSTTWINYGLRWYELSSLTAAALERAGLSDLLNQLYG